MEKNCDIVSCEAPSTSEEAELNSQPTYDQPIASKLIGIASKLTEPIPQPDKPFDSASLRFVLRILNDTDPERLAKAITGTDLKLIESIPTVADGQIKGLARILLPAEERLRLAVLER